MPERPFHNPYLNLALRYLVLLAGVYGYSLLVQHLGGFTTTHIYYQWLEAALILYFYSLFYFVLKPIAWRGLLAVVPILLVYLVHDAFFLVYGKVFRFINVSELPELLQILPWYYDGLLLLAFLLPLGLILWHANYRHLRLIGLWLAPLLLLILSVETLPSAFATGFRDVAHKIVKYSDGKSVENNGRLAMLFFREAQRVSVVDQIAPYHNRQAYNAAFNDKVKQLAPRVNHHNVHLIILESFLDPTLFRDLRFSQSPWHPDFAKLVGNKMSLSISPVFGGSTSQAEFEALCGVPAFAKLSSVEFNVFTGSAAHCLPDLLAHLGYRSVASNAFKPNFFNTLPAYQGLGFSERYFPVEYAPAEATYLHVDNPGEEEFVFDGKLFSEHREFVQRHLQQHKDQPLFDYLLTIYGHTPHILDPQKRPEIIKLTSSYPDDHLTRSTNQFYYRTQALAHHINELIKIDPNSLIIFMSDHVPPLRYGPNTYNALHYMDNIKDSIYYNRIAIFINGKIKHYPTLHHYDVPSVILDYLTDGAYCKHNTCDYLQTKHKPREAYLPAYLHLMASASE